MNYIEKEFFEDIVNYIDVEKIFTIEINNAKSLSEINNITSKLFNSISNIDEIKLNIIGTNIIRILHNKYISKSSLDDLLKRKIILDIDTFCISKSSLDDLLKRKIILYKENICNKISNNKYKIVLEQLHYKSISPIIWNFYRFLHNYNENDKLAMALYLENNIVGYLHFDGHDFEYVSVDLVYNYFGNITHKIKSLELI